MFALQVPRVCLSEDSLRIVVSKLVDFLKICVLTMKAIVFDFDL